MSAPAAESALLSSGEALAAGERRVGGKAMGLARLVGAGARVPEFIVVAAEALEAHLARAGIEGGAVESLRARVEEAPLDGSLAAAIAAALPRLGPGPFAVRSSMVGEDSAERSYAGQLETLLFQRDARDVARALVRCWGSAFSARVAAYRSREGASAAAALPRMGVVIQRMVHGEVSGVLFTADPVTGRRDQALLTAAWGLGEGIVSGLCNTDEYVVDEAGREVLVEVAEKDVRVVPARDGAPGTLEEEVPHAERDVRCLSPAEAAEVVREGARIAKAFGRPQDIEWTRAQGVLHILQSRPITALPDPDDGPRVVWDNSNIQESYCGVTTPLTFSFARTGYARAYAQAARAVGIPDHVLAPYQDTLQNLLGLLRGRVYYNINNWYRGLLLLPSFGRNKEDTEKMMGLETPVDFVHDLRLTPPQKLARLPRMLVTSGKLLLGFRALERSVPRWIAEFEAAVAKVDRRGLAGASFSSLMQTLELLRVEVSERWDIPIINDFFVMMSSGRLRRALEAAAGPAEAPRLLAALMGGEPGIESKEPARILVRLAARIRKDAAATATVRAGTPAEALAGLRARHAAITSDLDAYIERYGDRCMGELKLETVSHREDPSFLISVLRNYLDQPGLDPEALETRERAAREAAEREVFAKVGYLARRKLAKALADTRRGIKARENMRLARTRIFGLHRDIYRAIGERLRAAGRLDEARDVFYLTTQEIEAYWRGTSVSADLAPIARARKAEFAAYDADDMPNRLETVGPVYHGNRTRPPRASAAERAARILRGTGCSSGTVESELRVILSPEDDLSLRGKILTTLRTDPGWTPLFASASGVLVERGSTLSHSAVLARELGLPAVVGVKNLLKIVKDGERVRMDGGAGTIERLGVEERRP